jgi:RNA polymerase sigma factor (sigma-70 family)
MPQPSANTTFFLHQWRDGDEQARNQLIQHACGRLLCLTRKMLRSFPAVRAAEQTDDVSQNAAIRIHRALSEVKPESSRHFWNLAAKHIRWELLALASQCQRQAQYLICDNGNDGPALQNHTDGDSEPSSLSEWTDFHETVQGLPEKEREVFGLIWYDGLSQADVAIALDTSMRTVRRRWQSARHHLSKVLCGKCLK